MSTSIETMGNYQRVFDIELTNRCNALCSFCPRDQTPDQGFMSFDTFKKALDKAEELEAIPDIKFTGQGEPLLHPQLLEFAEYAQSRGIPYGMTTNASLLTTELSEKLIAAGLDGINFSISDMGDDYEEVYALNFNNTRKNIFDFMDINDKHGKPVKTMVNIVRHDLNTDKIKEYRKFWLDAGVDAFLFFEQNNRGGSCDNGHYFIGNDKYRNEARQLLADNSLSHVCGVPFMFVFVGWSGQYYICCNDYAKTTPLGSVHDHSIEAMDIIKKEGMCTKEGIEACNNCNMQPENKLREVLFEIDAGEASTNDLKSLLDKMQQGQSKLPLFARPL